MFSLFDIYEAIREFLETGGDVVVIIAFVIFIMWMLIFERLIYLLTGHRRRLKHALANWEAREDHASWRAFQIWTAEHSRIEMRLTTSIPLVRTLAAICPLLGLLGTAAGMIVVFDIMATIGSSSARAVASGVSQATISTMAGMVGALSGVFGAVFLAGRADHELYELEHGKRLSHQINLTRFHLLPPGMRILGSGLASLVVTLGLLFVMQQLIVTGKQAITGAGFSFDVDFVRVKRDETLERDEDEPEKPSTPEEAPEYMPDPQQADVDTGANVIGVRAGPSLSGRLVGDGIGIGGFTMVDADYMPIVKVAPMYPRRAASRGLEGWVMLRFTVTPLGTVTDVEVVDSTHALFEDAAIRAALKFKYKPRVVDGIALEVRGVLHKISFEIEE